MRIYSQQHHMSKYHSNIQIFNFKSMKVETFTCSQRTRPRSIKPTNAARIGPNPWQAALISIRPGQLYPRIKTCTHAKRSAQNTIISCHGFAPLRTAHTGTAARDRAQCDHPLLVTFHSYNARLCTRQPCVPTSQS